MRAVAEVIFGNRFASMRSNSSSANGQRPPRTFTAPTFGMAISPARLPVLTTVVTCWLVMENASARSFFRLGLGKPLPFWKQSLSALSRLRQTRWSAAAGTSASQGNSFFSPGSSVVIPG